MNFMGSMIPSLTVGGRVFTDLDNLFILQAFISGGSSIQHFYRTGVAANAVYQVTAGKTFYALAAKIWQGGPTTDQDVLVQLRQSDTGTGSGSNTVGLLTGVATGRTEDYIGLSKIVNSNFQEFAIFGKASAQKYIQAVNTSTASTYNMVQLFGYER